MDPLTDMPALQGSGESLSELLAPETKGRWAKFRAAVQRAKDFLDSNEIVANPVHRDFVIKAEGWFWNRVAQPRELPTHKVQFFFDRSDLPLLDGCEFHCKFAANLDPSKEFEFCGFAYPRVAKQLDAIEAWASRFPEASVFTYGRHEYHQWIPGEFLRRLSPK